MSEHFPGILRNKKIMQNSILFFFTALFLTISASWAKAEGRWALVLGISEYSNENIPNLKNTVNDARTIAASLNNMGFDVYYLENATKLDVKRTVRVIADEQNDADLGLFFFAGHGLQLEGVNYALPSDISPTDENFLSEQGISVNALIQELRNMGTRSLVVILDSCRNSPFGDRESFGTGLALTDAPENTIIAYSTAPGAVALDGTGANSPYSAALASVLDGPEQDIRDVLRLVRARVRLATRGTQTPWFIDNSKDSIVIRPRDAVEIDGASTDIVEGEVSLEATHWNTISNSSDPRDFELFAELFPETSLAEAAKRQVQLFQTDGRPQYPLMDLGVPDPNPDVPGGLAGLITECDVLATGVGNVLALVEPVPHDLVNTRAALRACISAVSDDPDNARLLGLLGRVLGLEKRYVEAKYYSERAASLGNPSAFGGLAVIYRLGLGVPVDNTRAAEAVRSGAMLGSAPIRLMMGVYYREGWGVQQSFSESRRWMEIAAISGYPSAITALGDLYRRGQGVTENPERALGYYRQAASLGSSDAMNNIGMAYMRGQGADQNFDLGIRWLTEASDEGNPYSAFHLGRAFLTGWGVEIDQPKALAYFRLSAQRNFLGAYIFIGDVLAADEQNYAEAYANYIIARDAGILRDTIASRKEQAKAEEKIVELTANLSPNQFANGERIAKDWIDQFGLLDFNLVNE